MIAIRLRTKPNEATSAKLLCRIGRSDTRSDHSISNIYDNGMSAVIGIFLPLAEVSSQKSQAIDFTRLYRRPYAKRSILFRDQRKKMKAIDCFPQFIVEPYRSFDILFDHRACCLALAVERMHRISKRILAALREVIVPLSKGGETSTRSAPMKSSPSSARIMRCASIMVMPPDFGVPVPGA